MFELLQIPPAFLETSLWFLWFGLRNIQKVKSPLDPIGFVWVENALMILTLQNIPADRAWTSHEHSVRSLFQRNKLHSGLLYILEHTALNIHSHGFIQAAEHNSPFKLPHNHLCLSLYISVSLPSLSQHSVSTLFSSLPF